MLLPSGNPLKCHVEALSLQLMIPPKRFGIFPLDWGMLRMSTCIHFLYKTLPVLCDAFFPFSAAVSTVQYSTVVLLILLMIIPDTTVQQVLHVDTDICVV